MKRPDCRAPFGVELSGVRLCEPWPLLGVALVIVDAELRGVPATAPLVEERRAAFLDADAPGLPKAALRLYGDPGPSLSGEDRNIVGETELDSGVGRSEARRLALPGEAGRNDEE